jgi:YD repeat-containing protein
MKKTLFVLIMLSLSISCQKPDADAEPVETNCLIQKISYDDGTYEVYKFDANNRLISSILTYEDNGKIVEAPQKYEYNAAGNLLKTKSDDGYIDEYIYDVSGMLTRVNFTDPKNELYEQFDLTMDAQKRITKIVSKIDGTVGKYEYNGPNGAFSKSEVTWEGKIIDEYVVNSYETDVTKKSYDIVIKGHPFDPSVFTNQIFYATPFNFGPKNALPITGKISTQYDENWTDLTDKLRVYYDFKATRKYNSNNFTTERASADAIEKQTYIKTYSYSNCN